MKPRSRLALACLAMLIAGCATGGGFQNLMNSWVGNDVKNTIMAWGATSDVFTLPNGNRMYTWLYVGGTRVTANYNSYLNMVTAGSVTYWCKTSFTANGDDRIIAWQGRSNACRA